MGDDVQLNTTHTYHVTQRGPTGFSRSSVERRMADGIAIPMDCYRLVCQAAKALFAIREP